jgi:hypothetical protein
MTAASKSFAPRKNIDKSQSRRKLPALNVNLQSLYHSCEQGSSSGFCSKGCHKQDGRAVKMETPGESSNLVHRSVPFTHSKYSQNLSAKQRSDGASPLSPLNVKLLPKFYASFSNFNKAVPIECPFAAYAEDAAEWWPDPARPSGQIRCAVVKNADLYPKRAGSTPLPTLVRSAKWPVSRDFLCKSCLEVRTSDLKIAEESIPDEPGCDSLSTLFQGQSGLFLTDC